MNNHVRYSENTIAKTAADPDWIDAQILLRKQAVQQREQMCTIRDGDV